MPSGSYTFARKYSSSVWPVMSSTMKPMTALQALQ